VVGSRNSRTFAHLIDRGRKRDEEWRRRWLLAANLHPLNEESLDCLYSPLACLVDRKEHRNIRCLSKCDHRVHLTMDWSCRTVLHFRSMIVCDRSALIIPLWQLIKFQNRLGNRRVGWNLSWILWNEQDKRRGLAGRSVDLYESLMFLFKFRLFSRIFSPARLAEEREWDDLYLITAEVFNLIIR